MKKSLFLLLTLFLMSVSCTAERHISIFADHIGTIAEQQHESFREAAQQVRALGYTGVDVSVTIDSARQAILDELGFAHASAIAFIDFFTGDHPEQVQQAIDFMVSHDYDRVLLVPGFLPKECTEEQYALFCQRTEAFAKAVKEQGKDAMVEDYDNPRSPCYNTEALDRLFALSPSLNHVFDTGNWLFAGEDVMTALTHFLPRIHHLHLKDRKAAGDSASPAVGTGIVPMQDVIAAMLKSGYEGWFTVEHYGARDMLESAAISFQTVDAAYDAYEATLPRHKFQGLFKNRNQKGKRQ